MSRKQNDHYDETKEEARVEMSDGEVERIVEATWEKILSQMDWTDDIYRTFGNSEEKVEALHESLYDYLEKQFTQALQSQREGLEAEKTKWACGHKGYRVCGKCADELEAENAKLRKKVQYCESAMNTDEQERYEVIAKKDAEIERLRKANNDWITTAGIDATRIVDLEKTVRLRLLEVEEGNRENQRLMQIINSRDFKTGYLGWKNLTIDLQVKVNELAAEKNEWKKKYKDLNTSLMAELRDPNGTIWEVAKQYRDENARLRDELAEAMDRKVPCSHVKENVIWSECPKCCMTVAEGSCEALQKKITDLEKRLAEAKEKEEAYYEQVFDENGELRTNKLDKRIKELEAEVKRLKHA